MKPQTRSALFFGGLIIAAALGANWAEGDGLIESSPDRVTGVFIGLILAWFGNLAPKQVPGQCCDQGTARHQAMRRFAGKMFVLGGLAHAAAWLAVPSPFAAKAAMAAIAVPLGIVIVRAAATRTFV